SGPDKGRVSISLALSERAASNRVNERGRGRSGAGSGRSLSWRLTAAELPNKALQFEEHRAGRPVRYHQQTHHTDRLTVRSPRPIERAHTPADRANGADQSFDPGLWNGHSPPDRRGPQSLPLPHALSDLGRRLGGQPAGPDQRGDKKSDRLVGGI